MLLHYHYDVDFGVVFQVGRGVGGGDSWEGGGAHVSDPTEGWNSQGYTHTAGNTFYLVFVYE